MTYGLFVDGLDIVVSLNTKATTANLNLQANTSDVYAKTAIINAYQPKIDTFVSPLKCIFNWATIKNELSIDSTAILSIRTINALSYCTIGGNLTVNGFIAAQPYASLRILTTGGTPPTGTTVRNIGTPGTVTLVQYGFLTNVSVARGTVETTQQFCFIFVYFTNRTPVGVKLYC
jgi:hypothetical protein